MDYDRAIKLQEEGIIKHFYGAIADYARAIALKPDYVNACYNRGIAKYKLGDYEGAIADYSRVIELDPEKASAYLGRGRAKSKLGNHDGAEVDRKRAIELDPEIEDR